MSEQQSCGTCRFFREHFDGRSGHCVWRKEHPSQVHPATIALITKPGWGRYCTEWEPRHDE